MSGKNKHKNEHASAADHNTAQKENTNRHVYIEPGVKMDFVQDLRDKFDAGQKDSASHSKKILLWTIISAALLFIYAGLTFWQGHIARKTLKTTSEFFQRDQRPYVFSTKINPAQAAPPHNLATQIFYLNYGKSPAMHERREGWIFYGDGALAQAYDWFKDLGDKPLKWDVRQGEGLLMQQEPAYTTIGSREPFSGDQSQVDALQYVIAWRVEYEDSFGARYWSDVCWWHPPEGGILRCIQHNEIH